MLVVCPTADYEIYFGENRVPVEEVLFEPTRKLLDLVRECDIPLTLFPDVCSVWRHRELGVPGYADVFEAQVKEAAGAGHDVQLHLHPEWRFAEYRDEKWHFKRGAHALHDLGFSADDPGSARALIREGKRYLEGLLQPGRPDYRCIAFRAGGWILQPEAELVSALLAEGIRVDATAIPGLKLPRTDYVVDFRKVPNKPNWFINPKTGLSRDSGQTSDLLEVSIGSHRGRFHEWQHAINELRLRRRAKAVPQENRGRPMATSGQKQGFLGKLMNKRRKLSYPRVLDMADTHESMLSTLTSYVRSYDCRTSHFAICMNGHPKDTYDFHLVELRRFFETVKSRYADVVEFRTLSQAYNSIISRPDARHPE